PKYILFPIIVVACVVGSYAINNGVMFDIWTLFIFGFLGYIFPKIGIQIPSFLIGFILGTNAEKYFIDSLKGSGGDLTIFFTKGPIAIFLWVLIIGSMIYAIIVSRKNRNEQAA